MIWKQNQQTTVAASEVAERKAIGLRPYRVATRLQSFKRPNVISVRLRFRYSADLAIHRLNYISYQRRY